MCISWHNTSGNNLYPESKFLYKSHKVNPNGNFSIMLLQFIEHRMI